LVVAIFLDKLVKFVTIDTNIESIVQIFPAISPIPTKFTENPYLINISKMDITASRNSLPKHKIDTN
jgi:hypothetical protein